MQKSTLNTLFAVTVALLLFSCADANTVKDVADAGGVHGFWWGLWNGLTAPISFIGSLFNSNINIYDVHNNGGFYNFGFLTGTGTLGLAGSRRRKP